MLEYNPEEETALLFSSGVKRSVAKTF